MDTNGVTTGTSDRKDATRRGLRRYTRYLPVAVGLLLVIGVLAVIKGAQISTILGAAEQAEKAGPPPEAVNAFVAQEQTWDQVLDAVGSVSAARGVVISNDAPGIVWSILFQSGAAVRTGQVLVELDTRVERGQLASALARRSLALTTAERTRALVRSGSLAQAQLDNDESQLEAATAEVKALSAQVERKIVRAPFDGKLGIRLVNVGQYLAAGTPITVLESEEDTYVDFALPQQNLPLIGVGMPVRIALDRADAGSTPSVAEGAVFTVEPALDATTRSIKLRASVPGEADWLRPGMFVNVSVVRPEKENVVAIPATAVVHASFGDSVFIIEDEKDSSGNSVMSPNSGPSKIVRQQFVRTGSLRGDFVAIDDGVKVGEEVVIGGAFKLRNGQRVAVTTAAQPRPELHPTPENR